MPHSTGKGRRQQNTCLSATCNQSTDKGLGSKPGSLERPQMKQCIKLSAVATTPKKTLAVPHITQAACDSAASALTALIGVITQRA
jgi:hypothetical protein